MNKYKSRKIFQNGESFDSKKEFLRYQDLILLQHAGKISDLRRQVKYTLIPAQREPDAIGSRGGMKKGRVIERECSYFADFVYTENGETVVEDVKGMRTKEYIMKRKLMLYVHGIRIRET